MVVSIRRATATTPDVKELVSDHEDLLSGDASKLDVVSESFTYYGPGLSEEGVQGRDAYGEFLQGFFGAFPDVESTITDVLVNDEVTMQEWTVTGTHEGEFNEILPTGREIEFKSMSKLVIADGKIQEERGYFNLQDLFAQLGVTE